MSFRSAFALFVALGLVACDGDGETDAGLPDGSVGEDAGAPYVCERTMALEGVLDESVEISFDTSMVDTAPQDLGFSCGNPDAEARWAPQVVVAYEVPGDEPVSVEFTTINPETNPNFIVFVQARLNDCNAILSGRFPPYCFGPVAPSPPAMEENAEWRSTGQVQANGGDTIFFFVTGFSEPPADERNLIDRGDVRFEVTARANEPPTLETALAVLDGEDLRVEGTGRDGNANARGVLLNFYDGAGEMIDIYGDGRATLENSVFQVRFDDPVSTGFDWSGGSWVRSTPDDGQTQLGEYLANVRPAEVGIRAYDAPNAISDMIRVPLAEATIVGFNEPCDAVTLCRPEMECDDTSNTCQPSATVSNRCAMLPDLGLPGFTTEAVTVNVTGNTRTNPSTFSPLVGCAAEVGGGGGPEAGYGYDVPPGATYDLILSTNQPGTGMTNTIVYVRQGCFDQGSELGCNDDGSVGVSSELEIRDLTGNGFIYVEELREMEPPGDGAYELSVTARPVLSTGMACDDAEVLNRCSAGPCAASVCP